MAAGPLRSIVYVRQSRDRDGTRAGVDRQLEDCTDLCERMGWTVIKVITDNDESADAARRRHRADYRPGYRELLSDIEHGACDAVVAWAQDRLLRDVREGEDLIDLVNRARVQLRTVQGGDEDLSTADGRMMVRLKAVVAKNESEKKADRQRRQARQAAERGHPPGRRAFGYRPGGMELEPAEALVVRDAFDRLLRGESLVTITRMLNESGLASVRGNRWHRKGVRYLLLSPRYAGLRVYRGEVVAAGGWPAIISREEHDAAVGLLTDPVRKANFGGTARRWLGSGLYLCGLCGSDVRVGYRSAANGSTRTYVCRTHGHLSRAAEPVDAFVVEVVEERLRRPDVAELLHVGDAPELVDLRAEAERLHAKIDKAVRDYDDDLIDAETLRAVKTRRRAELEVVQRKITAVARTSRLAQLAAAGDSVASWRALDLAARRLVVDALMTVTLLPGRPVRTAFDPQTVRIEWRTS